MLMLNLNQQTPDCQQLFIYCWGFKGVIYPATQTGVLLLCYVSPIVAQEDKRSLENDFCFMRSALYKTDVPP